MRIATAWAVFLAISASTVVAQPPLPTQAVHMGDRGTIGYDIRIPSTISQCEPILFYYNRSESTTYYFVFSSDVAGDVFFLITFPLGIGYLALMSNVPAGYGFVAVFDFAYLYVVQPGSSSFCLHDDTTTYASARYNNTILHSYTAQPPFTTMPSWAGTVANPETGPFPTGSFSTFTANPGLFQAVSSLTSPPSITSITHITTAAVSPSTVSSHPSSATSKSSRKSNTPAIAGGIVGGVIMVIACILIIARLRKRRPSQLQVVNLPTEVSPTGPSVPVVMSTTGATGYNWNPAVFHSSPPTSGELLHTTPDHAGILSWTPNAPSMAPKPDLPTHSYLQTPEHLHPQSHTATPPVATTFLHPSTNQRGVSLYPTEATTSSSMSGCQSQPASTPAESETSDILTALNTLSRLSPTRRREISPLFNTIMATPQTATRDSSVPDAPPAYSG